MKILAVDIEEIAELMETSLDESEGYLDLQTGKTVLMPSELLDRDDDDDDSSSIPDWERELLPVAEAIDAGSDRYVPIPDVPAFEAYEDMARFAGTVSDSGLRRRLEEALDGKGAFRWFRSVLHSDPEEQKRWYAFKNEAQAQRVLEWLHEIGVAPAGGTPKP